VDKRKPSHDLSAFKAAMATPKALAITVTAARSALDLGFDRSDIVDALQSLERTHFYKSTTAHANARQWHDVYHLPWDDDLLIYVKFTDSVVTGFIVMSFKEK